MKPSTYLKQPLEGAKNVLIKLLLFYCHPKKMHVTYKTRDTLVTSFTVVIR